MTALGELSVGEWGVLGLLSEKTTHGFALAREFRPDGVVGRVWTLPHPLVYRAITTLKARGYIRPAGSSRGSTGPQRTLLAITPEGELALSAWLEEPIEHVRDARSLLLLKLLFLERAGRGHDRLVAAQRSRLVPMLEGLRARVEGAEGFDAVIARWRLSTAEALNDFLTQLVVAGSPGKRS